MISLTDIHISVYNWEETIRAGSIFNIVDIFRCDQCTALYVECDKLLPINAPNGSNVICVHCNNWIKPDARGWWFPSVYFTRYEPWILKQLNDLLLQYKISLNYDGD